MHASWCKLGLEAREQAELCAVLLWIAQAGSAVDHYLFNSKEVSLYDGQVPNFLSKIRWTRRDCPIEKSAHAQQRR
jgi:hypothetical protein